MSKRHKQPFAVIYPVPFEISWEYRDFTDKEYSDIDFMKSELKKYLKKLNWIW